MPNEYVTVKTDVAAFCMARGRMLLDIRREGPQCVFVFGSEAADDADAYERNAAVPAQQFAEAWHKLKGLIARTKSTTVNPPINPSRKESINANPRLK